MTMAMTVDSVAQKAATADYQRHILKPWLKYSAVYTETRKQLGEIALQAIELGFLSRLSRDSGFPESEIRWLADYAEGLEQLDDVPETLDQRTIETIVVASKRAELPHVEVAKLMREADKQRWGHELAGATIRDRYRKPKPVEPSQTPAKAQVPKAHFEVVLDLDPIKFSIEFGEPSISTAWTRIRKCYKAQHPDAAPLPEQSPGYLKLRRKEAN